MNTRTGNRISGVLGIEAPWKILFGLAAVGLFLSYLLHFRPVRGRMGHFGASCQKLLT